MREAGRISARALRLVGRGGATRRDDGRARLRSPRRPSARTGRYPAFQGLPRLSRARSAPRSTARSFTGSPREGRARRGRHRSRSTSAPIVDGYYGDNARTFPVGSVERGGAAAARRDRALARLPGSRAAAPGRPALRHRHAVQAVAEGAGFSVVREYVGPRDRPGDARGSQGAELRSAGTGPTLQTGHGLRHRADDQRRAAAVRVARRRVDGRDRRTDRCRRTSSTRWRHADGPLVLTLEMSVRAHSALDLPDGDCAIYSHLRLQAPRGRARRE